MKNNIYTLVMALLLAAISYELYTISHDSSLTNTAAESSYMVQNNTENYATLNNRESSLQYEEEQMDTRLAFADYIDYE